MIRDRNFKIRRKRFYQEAGDRDLKKRPFARDAQDRRGAQCQPAAFRSARGNRRRRVPPRSAGFQAAGPGPPPALSRATAAPGHGRGARGESRGGRVPGVEGARLSGRRRGRYRRRNLGGISASRPYLDGFQRAVGRFRSDRVCREGYQGCCGARFGSRSGTPSPVPSRSRARNKRSTARAEVRTRRPAYGGCAV